MFNKDTEFFKKIGVLRTGKNADNDLQVDTKIDNDNNID